MEQINVAANNEAKERVCKELEELNEKIVKLSAFLFSTRVLALSEEMQRAMHDQLRAMQEYAKVLIYRIQIWDMTDSEIYQRKNSVCNY